MDDGFEELEHTADVAIRVWGANLAELFANAARAMACQLANSTDVARTVMREIELTEDDGETLLVAWLSELLYLGERDECVFVGFDVREIGAGRLRAVVWGGPVGEYRRYIKAVTFSDLAIQRTENGYEAVVVFDV